MCLINDEQVRVEIRRAILSFTEKSEKFTGWQIYRRMIDRRTPARGAFGHSDVTSYVRELYNLHDPVFTGYGSYPVPEGGPLLFFPVPEEVVEHGKKILFDIKSTAAEKQEASTESSPTAPN